MKNNFCAVIKFNLTLIMLILTITMNAQQQDSAYNPPYIPFIYKTKYSKLGAKYEYRQAISALAQKAGEQRRKNPILAVQYYADVIAFCDGNYGFTDFTNDIAPGAPFHSITYIQDLRSMRCPERVIAELMMERHMYYFRDQGYFTRSDKSKKDYLSGIFRKHHDQFASYVYEYNKYLPYMAGKLYNYQLAAKGAPLLAEIKMKAQLRKLSQLENTDSLTKNYIHAWELNNDTVINGSEVQPILYFVSETGLSASDYFYESGEVYGTNFHSKDTLHYKWTDIQSALRDDEASVEIIRSRKYTGNVLSDTVMYFALIVLKDSQQPHLISLPNGDDMEKSFFQFYQNSIMHKITDTLSFNRYWQEIDDYLKQHKIKNVFICSDGIYHSINISTLFDAKTNRYVVDNLNIHYVANSKNLISSVASLKLEDNEVQFGNPAKHKTKKRK